MGILIGYLCLICGVLLLAKFFAKRMGFKKADRFFMRIHKYVACAFFILGLIHFCLVIKVLDTRHIAVTISGIVIWVIGLILTIICHTMKDRKREIQFHRAFSFVLAFAIVVHVISYYVDYNNYQESISSIKLEGINLKNVSDGEYIGEYDAGYIYAKVKVTIKKNKIYNIDILKHDNERGQRAESIIDSIIQKQRFDVDAISGATNSSLVIEKACENAVREGNGKKN